MLCPNIKKAAEITNCIYCFETIVIVAAVQLKLPAVVVTEHKMDTPSQT